MYALPPRQRRRNNYSRTILADRAGDMLPHLSTKQLLSVKELLLSAGFVNRVVTRPVTLRELLNYPSGTSQGYPVYSYPLFQSGLRLIRTVVNFFAVGRPRTLVYSLNSKPDRSGTEYARTSVPLSESVMIRWPTPVDPYLFTVDFDLSGSLNSYTKNLVDNDHLGYYPVIELIFNSTPEPNDEHIDDVILMSYYLN